MKNKEVEKVEEPKYVVKNDVISWSYRRGEITMTTDSLDELFYQYSKHGLNMSQVQVQNKHGLDALEWQSLKRTFDLVKDSDVFSPYTCSLYKGKELTDMIAAKIAEKYSAKNMRDVIAYEDNKQTKRAYEKAIKGIEKKSYNWNLLADAVLEYTSQGKKVNVRKCKTATGKKEVVIICDIHGGAEILPKRNLPAFNYGVIVKRLTEIAEDTNSLNSSGITLVFNGDFIETFTGLNHINSWQGIAKKNGYGVDATIKITEIITDFIASLNNVDEILLISGNHDRVTSNAGEDVQGDAVKIIHTILNARFGHEMNVEWSPDVITRKIDGCGFIFAHGHLVMCKNPQNLVDLYGYKGCFNIVLLAHLHSRIIKKDHTSFRVVHCASIFTGNTYSKQGGYTSLAGYTHINVANKLPVVTDRPVA